ncbi:MAG TPA: 2-oxo acid dehydrogenase subunit E2 [Firmicutes bacterium]|nr:2-oxo acid dehydrogenase subunit E2 [Bacillota bacterium]
MAQEVLMPKLGLTMTEGTICAWLKPDGSYVNKGDPIFEVETDKITNKVEAMDEGILKIVLPEGSTAKVTQVVGYLLAEGEEIPAEAADVAAPATATAAPQEEVKAAAVPAEPKKEPVRVRATPAAKRRARESGIDLTQVTGTGPGGRIVEADVESYLEQQKELPATLPSEGEISAPVKATPTAVKLARDLGIDLAELSQERRLTKRDVLAAALLAEEGEEERVPLAGMRKVIAQHMLESWTVAPHVTINMEVEMDRARAIRKELNADCTQEDRISYNDLIIKAAAQALTEYPALNGTIDAEEIIYHNYVHMGVAVALEDGLIVPVVRHADKKSLREVAREVKDLAQRARAERLSLDEVTGSTFTVTNLGMFGVDDFTPIINQPESAILGVGTIKERPVVVDGSIDIRLTMTLSLSFDHRLVDGSVAAEFLGRVRELLEKPYGVRPEIA